MTIASLKEVHQLIEDAIRPCSTAPEKMSGITHAHMSFIKRSAITNTTANIAIPVRMTGTIQIHHLNHFLAILTKSKPDI